jgi:methanethiol oxidase
VNSVAAPVRLWHRDGERWSVRKVVTIAAEPADPDDLPPALKPFGAVPPLVSDIDLSVDDRWLYVSCWGTGELKQYDVSDPFAPREAGSVRLGGIVRRQPHPSAPNRRLGGGPQMVELSRDGAPRLRHQLALRVLGPHLLPRGRGSLDGQARRRPRRRRPRRRPAVLPQR